MVNSLLEAEADRVFGVMGSLSLAQQVSLMQDSIDPSDSLEQTVSWIPKAC